MPQSQYSIPQSHHSTPVVLVVDDEAILRMYAVDMFVQEGFHAFEAGDGAEALIQLGAHPEISVLFTDINMPGAMDGLALARIVCQRRPDVQLIITSGRAKPPQAEIPDRGQFLAKPYDPWVLARMVWSGRAQ